MTGEGDFQTTSARNSRTSTNANSQMHNGSLPDGARRVLCVVQLTTSIQTNWSGVPRYGRSNAEPIDPFLHPLRWQLHPRSLLMPTTSDEFQTSVHTMDISARHHSPRRDISVAGEIFPPPANYSFHVSFSLSLLVTGTLRSSNLTSATLLTPKHCIKQLSVLSIYVILCLF